MLDILRKFKEKYTNVIVVLCAIICSVILIMNVVQCVLRYLTDIGFHYTEDVTIIGMLWIMGLGISIGWMNREHLLINLIDNFVKGKKMEILMFCLDLFGIVVGIAMVWLGRLTQEINTGLVMSVIGFDESFRYWPLVVGGALTAMASTVCVWEQILLWKEEAKK